FLGESAGFSRRTGESAVFREGSICSIACLKWASYEMLLPDFRSGFIFEIISGEIISELRDRDRNQFLFPGNLRSTSLCVTGLNCFWTNSLMIPPVPIRPGGESHHFRPAE